MLKLYLPPVPPLTGGNVIVSKDVWVELIAYINTMQDTINTQASKIVDLSKQLNVANENISKIAVAVGGLYDET